MGLEGRMETLGKKINYAARSLKMGQRIEAREMLKCGVL